MITRAAILVESGHPLVVDEIAVPALQAGQVLVEIHYSTICGAQLNEIDAVKGPDKFLPHLLGHEASGHVKDVGPGVTHAKRGDTVVMHWRPSQGIQARPAGYEWKSGDLNPQRVNAGWVTTFQDRAIVSENRLTVIPPDTDLKTACLLGCAATTAMGIVNNDAKVKVGESVVVFGVGGVGLNVVQFAAAAGAYPIVAVDVDEAKLMLALKYGATYAMDGVLTRGPPAVLYDKVIETTGLKSVIELAYEITHSKGTCVLVGVPKEPVLIYTLPLHLGKTLTGSEGGGARPHIDIPRILKLVKAGKISFDGQITHEFPWEKINDAIEVMRSGKCGRVLIEMG